FDTLRSSAQGRRPTNRLDASGGSVFLNLLGAAKGALIRAAASTQPLYCYSHEVVEVLDTARDLIHCDTGISLPWHCFWWGWTRQLFARQTSVSFYHALDAGFRFHRCTLHSSGDYSISGLWFHSRCG